MRRRPQNAQIAQLVEQRTENPRVAGSIPALGIYFFAKITFLNSETDDNRMNGGSNSSERDCEIK